MVIGLLLAGSFLGHLFGFGVVIFVFGFDLEILIKNLILEEQFHL